MQWKREEGKRNKIKARERVNDSMPIFSFSWVNKFENKFGRYFWIISEKTCDETIAKLGQILRELTFFLFRQLMSTLCICFILLYILSSMSVSSSIQHPTSRSKKIVEKGKMKIFWQFEWVCVAHVYLFIYSFFSSLTHSICIYWNLPLYIFLALNVILKLFLSL